MDLVLITDRLHEHIVREMHGRTEVEVAARAGVSKQYVSNVVRRTHPTRRRDKLTLLTRSLKIDLSAYEIDPAKEPFTLPQRYNQLTLADRRRAVKILDLVFALKPRRRR